MNRSIASTETDWKALPVFSYVEQDEHIEGGEKTTRTYRVCMLAGSPYSRLTEVDSQPLSPTQSNQEAEKLRSATPLTRRMPATSSGLSNALSDAS